MSDPLISIITVVYNGANFLEDTIRSVLSQNYKNYEYIIIDGGSTDSSVDIIKKYDTFLKYWVSEPDNGMYDAINKGIKVASGDIWTSLNSDDRLATETVFSTVASSYIEKPGYFAYFGDIIKEKEGVRRYVGLNNVNFFKLRSSRHCTFMPQPATYNVKKYTNEVGLFDDQYRYAADYDYHLRLLKKGKALHIPQPFTIFLQHDQALTSTGNDKMHAEKVEILGRHGYGESPVREKISYFVSWSLYTLKNKIFKMNPL